MLIDTYAQATDAPSSTPHLRGRSGDPAERLDAGARAADGEPGAQRFFADLGYWSNLQCNAVPDSCPAARDRLLQALRTSLPDGGTVADRVMYGTDWFMLSREPTRPTYPDAILDALTGSGAIDKVLGENAAKLFRL